MLFDSGEHERSLCFAFCYSGKKCFSFRFCGHIFLLRGCGSSRDVFFSLWPDSIVYTDLLLTKIFQKIWSGSRARLWGL